jgi:hypothetical protein
MTFHFSSPLHEALTNAGYSVMCRMEGTRFEKTQFRYCFMSAKNTSESFPAKGENSMYTTCPLLKAICDLTAT